MKHSCCKEILPPQMLHFRKCKNKAVVERDGDWYCRIHDPENAVKRQENRDKRRKKLDARRRAMHLAMIVLKKKRA